VGLGLGAEVDFIAYLTSRYFGLRAFGKVYSSIFAAFTFSGALGPMMMGVCFERTGSYGGAVLVFLAASLIAAALMTRLGPYPYQARKPELGEQILPDSGEGPAFAKSDPQNDEGCWTAENRSMEECVTASSLHRRPTSKRFFSAINACELTEAIKTVIGKGNLRSDHRRQ